MDNQSLLKIYSVGIVVEDKKRETDFVKVTPMEHLPLQSGDIGSQKIQYDINLPDLKGVKRKNKVEGSNFIIAKWIQFGGSNRMTAPDVIKGETILLFRFGDEEDFYWSPMFREPGIRRQETVMYAYGNIPTGHTKWDKGTSYYFDVSTHDKYALFHTSSNDGEYTTYDVRFDTKLGNFKLTDGRNNHIALDSKRDHFHINTNKTIYAYTRDTIHMRSSSLIWLQSNCVRLDHGGCFRIRDDRGNYIEFPYENRDHLDIYTRKSIDTVSTYIDTMVRSGGTNMNRDPNGNSILLNSASNLVNIATNSDIKMQTKDTRVDSQDTIKMFTTNTLLNSSQDVKVVTTNTLLNSSQDVKVVTTNTLVESSFDIKAFTTHTLLNSSQDVKVVTTNTLVESSHDIQAFTTHTLLNSSQDVHVITTNTLVESSFDIKAFTTHTLLNSSQDVHVITTNTLVESSFDIQAFTTHTLLNSSQDVHVITTNTLVESSFDIQAFTTHTLLNSSQDVHVITTNTLIESSYDIKAFTAHTLLNSSQDVHIITTDTLIESSQNFDIITNNTKLISNIKVEISTNTTDIVSNNFIKVKTNYLEIEAANVVIKGDLRVEGDILSTGDITGTRVYGSNLRYINN